MPNLVVSEDALSTRDVFRRSPGSITLQDAGTLVSQIPTFTFDFGLSGMRTVRFEQPNLYWAELPKWVEPTLAGLYSKLALSPNWDAYGALPIDERNVHRAIKILAEIMSENTVAPWVVPSNDGGIQLEWHRQNENLEVEIGGNEGSSIYFYNALTREEWECPLAENIPRLRAMLAQWTTP